MNTNTLTVSGGGSFAGVIQDNGTGSGLTVSGGTLTLTGANTYSGTTTISGGTLALGSGGAIYSGVTPGGQVNVTGTFDMSGASSNQAIGDLTGSGTVNLGANTLTLNDSTTQTYSGAIQGTGGSLALSGGGVLTLSGTNTFSGLTTLSGGSTLIYSGTGAIGNTRTINVASGTSVVLSGIGTSGSSSSTLNMVGTGSTYASNTYATSGDALESASGTNTFADNINLTGSSASVGVDAGTLALSGAIGNTLSTGTATLFLNGENTGTDTISGIISNGTSGGTTALNLENGFNTATWQLLNANTYSGLTTVGGGTLQLGSGGSINSGNAMTISSGAVFDLNGQSQTLGVLTNGGKRDEQHLRWCAHHRQRLEWGGQLHRGHEPDSQRRQQHRDFTEWQHQQFRHSR